jgi:hypothetical protein
MKINMEEIIPPKEKQKENKQYAKKTAPLSHYWYKIMLFLKEEEMHR